MTRYKVGDIILRKSGMFIVNHNNKGKVSCKLCCFNIEGFCSGSRKSSLIDDSLCSDLINSSNGDYFKKLEGGL